VLKCVPLTALLIKLTPRVAEKLLLSSRDNENASLKNARRIIFNENLLYLPNILLLFLFITIYFLGI
jgi:hypothetical protein